MTVYGPPFKRMARPRILGLDRRYFATACNSGWRLWPMSMVLGMREIASDGGMSGQHVEIMGRDASSVKILPPGSRPEIDARSSSA